MTAAPRRRHRFAAVALTAGALLLTGCASSVEPRPEPLPPAAPLPGLGAPIILNETERRALVQLGRDSVVFSVKDPTSWTATISPADAGLFIPGTDVDGLVTNPAVELTRIGDVTVTLTNSTGRTLQFVLTVISPTSEFESISRLASQFTANLVGLTESDATAQIEEAGLTFRVVSRDGVGLPATKDYSPRRINLEIVDGLVVGALIG
jgi:hypothetical protein